MSLVAVVVINLLMFTPYTLKK